MAALTDRVHRSRTILLSARVAIIIKRFVIAKNQLVVTGARNLTGHAEAKSLNSTRALTVTSRIGT